MPRVPHPGRAAWHPATFRPDGTGCHPLASRQETLLQAQDVNCRSQCVDSGGPAGAAKEPGSPDRPQAVQAGRQQVGQQAPPHPQAWAPHGLLRMTRRNRLTEWKGHLALNRGQKRGQRPPRAPSWGPAVASTPGSPEPWSVAAEARWVSGLPLPILRLGIAKLRNLEACKISGHQDRQQPGKSQLSRTPRPQGPGHSRAVEEAASPATCSPGKAFGAVPQGETALLESYRWALLAMGLPGPGLGLT